MRYAWDGTFRLADEYSEWGVTMTKLGPPNGIAVNDSGVNWWLYDAVVIAFDCEAWIDKRSGISSTIGRKMMQFITMERSKSKLFAIERLTEQAEYMYS